MNFLLDTCVLSELVKPAPDAGVLSWLSARQPHQLFVSAMTLGELQRGVMRLQASRRREELSGWLSTLVQDFEGRVLPFSHDTARAWAELCVRAEAQGKRLAAFDSVIAATALHHGLVMVTRNERDFDPAGIRLHNPWARPNEAAGA